jgi:hypothetical protein
VPFEIPLKMSSIPHGVLKNMVKYVLFENLWNTLEVRKKKITKRINVDQMKF